MRQSFSMIDRAAVPVIVCAVRSTVRSTVRVIVCATSFACVVAVPSLSFAERFDTSAFAKGLDANEPANAQLDLLTLENEDEIDGDKKDGDKEGDKAAVKLDAAALDVRINSFTTLIRTSHSPQEKGQFLLNRAISYLHKARLTNKDKSANEARRQAADAAAADAVAVTKLKGLSSLSQAYALYLQAVALTELSRRDEAAKILRTAIKLSPKAPFVSGAVFFIAEHDFERQKYLQSLRFLKSYLSQLKGEQRAMALYKMAWCYIGLQELPAAQALFVDLVRSSDSSQFAQTSIKEFAFVAAQIHNDAGILKLADEVFPSEPTKKVEFLSSAYSHLQRLNPGSEHQAVLAVLMKIAGAPEKRIQLWIEEMRSVSGQTASERSIGLLEAVKSELARLNASDLERVMRMLGDEIALETERTIRSYVDAFTGKIANREGLSKTRLVKSLRSVFEFHERFLNKALSRTAMFRLWFDVCSDHKDYECILEAANRVMRDPKADELKSQAAIERIVALDALVRQERKSTSGRDKSEKGDSSGRKGELIAALEEYMENEDAPRWPEFARLLTDLYVIDRQFTRALPILAAVNNLEKSEESFYRLQWARLQAGQFQQVMNAKPAKESMRSKRVRELEKQAALRLAMGNDDGKGEFTSYETGVSRFLEVNDDRNQQTIVATAYLNKLIDRGDLSRAAEQFKKMDKDRFDRPGLAGARRRLATKLMLQGAFADAATIVEVTDPNDGTLYESVLARLGLRRNVEVSEFMSLAPEQKEYIFGLLALTRPRALLKILRSTAVSEPSSGSSKKKLSLTLRRLGFLALQIDQRKIEPKVSSSMTAILGDAIPSSKRGTGANSTEGLAAAVKFPGADLSEKRLADALNKSMAAVRGVRKQVPADLQRNRDPSIRRRILAAAMKLEARMAVAIEKSPVPRGMAGDQRLAYMRGLGEVAKEFQLQAEDFRKAMANLDAKASEGGDSETEASPFDRRPASFSVETWP